MESMTGYGQGRSGNQEVEYQIEARSLNHRYLDINIRLPQTVSPLEEKVREQVRSCFHRGRVDIFISRLQGAGETKLLVDQELAGDYIGVIRDLAKQYSLPDRLTAEGLTSLPGVVTTVARQVEMDAEWELLAPALNQALKTLREQRQAEGRRLGEDISLRLNLILKAVNQIEELSPRAVEEYRQKLEQRMRELLADVSPDENRLLTETALLAERTSITEELVRLRSHCRAMEEIMASKEPIGRKMDFTLQEMNREINTISSKSQDYQIARLVIEIKSQLEKMREQSQNIE